MDVYDKLGQRIAAEARAAATRQGAEGETYAALFLEHGIAQLKAQGAGDMVREPDQALGRLRAIIYQGTVDPASAVAELTLLADRWLGQQAGYKARYKVAPPTLKDLIDQAFGPDRR
jgi:hypothetical protein